MDKINLRLCGGRLAVATLLAFASPASLNAAPAPVDYMTASFHMTRLLDWGTRPDWSPDGSKIAFTESDFNDTHAYELDLKTHEVRCLTCSLGMNGLVTRVYYMPDGSFLFLAPRDLAGAEQRKRTTIRSNTPQELYWAPASLDRPPQPLQAPAMGEIAISRKLSEDGGVQIAWGFYEGANSKQLRIATLVHDGQGARLVNSRVLLDAKQPSKPAGVNGYETYDFANEDRAVVFFTIDMGSGVPNGEMYEVDIASGTVHPLYTDPAHNETHLFPDERYGLEESNRVSDPSGYWRGISAFPAEVIPWVLPGLHMKVPTEEELSNYAPNGNLKGFKRPFDLFVVAIDGLGSVKRRQLTDVSRFGAEAHQSAPAPDGRHIAFAIDERCSDQFAGKTGLYIGEFGPER
jgi:hypothetical protein